MATSDRRLPRPLQAWPVWKQVRSRRRSGSVANGVAADLATRSGQAKNRTIAGRRKQSNMAIGWPGWPRHSSILRLDPNQFGTARRVDLTNLFDIATPQRFFRI